MLNAQALLRIPRLNLSPPAKAGSKLNSPPLFHLWTPKSSGLMLEAADFGTWKGREKGKRSKVVSHMMQLPNYVILKLFYALASLHRAGCPHSMGLNPLNHPQKSSTEEEELS